MTFESAIKHPHQAPAHKLMVSEGLAGYYIMGPVGCGKTYMLAAMVNSVIASGMAAALITVPQLLMSAQGVKGGISELERLACVVPYLALDDIGKEQLSGYKAGDARDMLFRIMDARYLLYSRKKGYTSFSSQWPRDEVENSLTLKDKLDEAVVSRIRGMTLKIFLKGPDLRTEGSV